jgi:hypothetical protein
VFASGLDPPPNQVTISYSTVQYSTVLHCIEQRVLWYPITAYAILFILQMTRVIQFQIPIIFRSGIGRKKKQPQNHQFTFSDLQRTLVRPFPMTMY